MKQRLLSLLLSLVLCLSLPPVGALAVDEQGYPLSGIPEEHVTVTVNGTAQTPKDGTLTVKAGQEVKVSPEDGYRFKDFLVKSTSENPSTTATVTLVAGDVWEDGSGYQMLLDSDCNTYGSTFPETGGLTQYGDASAEVYKEFEFKIPENADGSLTTQNIVLNGRETNR